MSKALVHCPVCSEKLPVDYLECPLCGTHNPQLHMIERREIKLLIETPVMRALEKMSIRLGRPVHDLATEAIEHYIMKKGM